MGKGPSKLLLLLSNSSQGVVHRLRKEAGKQNCTVHGAEYPCHAIMATTRVLHSAWLEKAEYRGLTGPDGRRVVGVECKHCMKGKGPILGCIMVPEIAAHISAYIYLLQGIKFKVQLDVENTG